MALIVYGYRKGLYNKRFLGIKPCGSCGKFAERYLSRGYFQITLFYILPIFGVPTGRYLRCGNCNGMKKLTREEWKQLKEESRGMPKKKNYRMAYEELKQLVLKAEPGELDADIIYNRLLGKLDFTDENGHIKKLVQVYLENSRNAAIISGAAAEAAEAETAAVAAEAAENTAPEANEEPSNQVEQPEEITVPAAEPAAAEEIPAVQKSLPAAEPAPAEEAKPEAFSAVPASPIRLPRSRKRFWWLLPAILLLPVGILLASVAIETLIEDIALSVAIGPSIVATVIFLIPLALSVLFFVLALKKYHKV